MSTILTKDDLDFILESLNYTKQRFEDYPVMGTLPNSTVIGYPSYEFKLMRLRDVEGVRQKIMAMRKEVKK